MTAQRIPLLGLYIVASFLGASGRLHGTILQDRREATPDSRLCGFLATVQLNVLLRTAAFHRYQISDNEYLMV